MFINLFHIQWSMYNFYSILNYLKPNTVIKMCTEEIYYVLRVNEE